MQEIICDYSNNAHNSITFNLLKESERPKKEKEKRKPITLLLNFREWNYDQINVCTKLKLK